MLRGSRNPPRQRHASVIGAKDPLSGPSIIMEYSLSIAICLGNVQLEPKTRSDARESAQSMAGLFISHSSQDDAFVRELRAALADHGQAGWID